MMAATTKMYEENEAFIDRTLNYIKERETDAYNKGFDAGYKRAEEKDIKMHEYSFDLGIRTVCRAAEWFHDTYGTEYIVYGEDSIKHLIDIYEEGSKVGRSES